MTKETLLEVVSELIGYTEPYGDTNVDEVRYKNQEKIIGQYSRTMRVIT